MSQSQGRRGSGASLARRVGEAVANREGVDSVEVEPPLHSTIDTDALEASFDHAGSEALRPGYSRLGEGVVVGEDGVDLLDG